MVQTKEYNIVRAHGGEIKVSGHFGSPDTYDITRTAKTLAGIVFPLAFGKVYGSEVKTRW